MSIDRINVCLARYYKQFGRDYHDDVNKSGKFKAYCDENGFDDDGVEEEMKTNADECQLVDFDNNFPLPYQPENKEAAIFEILKESYQDAEAFFYPIRINLKPPLKLQQKDFQISEQQIKKTQTILEKQLKTIWDNEFANDKDILKILSVSFIINKPYIQYLVDMYLRDRIKSLSNGLNIADWIQQNKHFKQLLTMSNGAAIVNGAKSAIQTFFSRVCPCIIYPPEYKIRDSLEKISEYILAIVSFVNSLARQKNTTCPFQVDNCIIFNSTEDTMQMAEFVGDDDDKDAEIDEKDDKKDPYSIGDIKAKLVKEKLKYLAARISDSKYNMGLPDISALSHDSSSGSTQVTTSSRFTHQFNEFKNNILSKKYKGKAFNDYPRNKRFITVVDRRRKKHENKTFLLDSDEVIFFEPPSNCNTFPVNRSPLWGFDSSRTCIIPNIGYDNGIHETEIQTQIHSKCSCNGKLMVLSFHVESSEEIKCYCYINGQVTRFFAKDILDVLPLFFIENKQNKEFVQSKTAKKSVKYVREKLIDLPFESFYQEYTTRISMNNKHKNKQSQNNIHISENIDDNDSKYNPQQYDKTLTGLINWLKKHECSLKYPLHYKIFEDGLNEQFDESTELDMDDIIEELESINTDDEDDCEYISAMKNDDNCRSNYVQYVQELIKALNSYKKDVITK
eukprot:538415_1